VIKQWTRVCQWQSSEVTAFLAGVRAVLVAAAAAEQRKRAAGDIQDMVISFCNTGYKCGSDKSSTGVTQRCMLYRAYLEQFFLGPESWQLHGSVRAGRHDQCLSVYRICGVGLLLRCCSKLQSRRVHTISLTTEGTAQTGSAYSRIIMGQQSCVSQLQPDGQRDAQLSMSLNMNRGFEEPVSSLMEQP
jgi:hypothetical protein